MLRVYQVVSNLAPVPLIVIASDGGGAYRIFSGWADRHHPSEHVGRVEVGLVSSTAIALQPQLAAASAGGAEGVAYWCGHRLGYFVCAPHEVQFGAIGPAETPVMCFEVIEEYEVQLVFAHSAEHAFALFDEWSRLANGHGGESATVEVMSRWLLGGPLVTLREDMDVGLTGVGSVCEDGFWHIFPADYEPSFG